MTIRSKKELEDRSLEIDLTGPQGNAYFLLAQAETLSEQLGLDFTPIHQRMISGDYENLIAVFEEVFGAYVTLYR